MPKAAASPEAFLRTGLARYLAQRRHKPRVTPAPREAIRAVTGEAAPREVKDLVFRASKRLELPVVLVANMHLQTPPGYPLVSAVWVDGGPDVAEFQ